MEMPGRRFSASSEYRYGFNGKENDKDISEGAQDYGMRIYDARIGKFLSVDPLTKEYAELTPYQFASNSPISMIDIDGAEGGFELSAASSHINRHFEMQTFRTRLQASNPVTKAPIPRIQPVHSEAAPIAVRQAKERAMTVSRPYIPKPATIVSYDRPATPYEKQQAEDYRIEQNRKNNLNDDGSQKSLDNLADSKTFQRFNDNLVEPLMILDGAYSVGKGIYAFGKVGLSFVKSTFATKTAGELIEGAMTVGGNLLDDEIILTTSSKSLAPSRTYTIFDGSGNLFKFGVTDADLGRYNQSLKLAGPGAFGTFSPVMPKNQAHLMEKYLRSLHYNSTGQYALPGMKYPFPVDFTTGKPIKL